MPLRSGQSWSQKPGLSNSYATSAEPKACSAHSPHPKGPGHCSRATAVTRGGQGQENHCYPRRLVICEYTPERLLIWLEKRSRITLMMVRWKYEPYVWSSKTIRRRRQRDETAQSGLCDLNQRWRPWVSRALSFVEDHFYQYVSRRLKLCLLSTAPLCCWVCIAGIYRCNSCVHTIRVLVLRSQRSRDCQMQICSWWCCAAVGAAADAAVGAAASSTPAAAAAAISRSSCQ